MVFSHEEFIHCVASGWCCENDAAAATAVKSFTGSRAFLYHLSFQGDDDGSFAVSVLYFVGYVRSLKMGSSSGPSTLHVI